MDTLESSKSEVRRRLNGWAASLSLRKLMIHRSQATTLTTQITWDFGALDRTMSLVWNNLIKAITLELSVNDSLPSISQVCFTLMIKPKEAKNWDWNNSTSSALLHWETSSVGSKRFIQIGANSVVSTKYNWMIPTLLFQQLNCWGFWLTKKIWCSHKHGISCNKHSLTRITQFCLKHWRNGLSLFWVNYCQDIWN